MTMKYLVVCCYLLWLASAANAATVVKGDLQISGGGDLVFSDGSVQSTAQVRGSIGPQGPPGEVTLSAICDAIKTANAAMPSFCPDSAPIGSLSIYASATGSVITATATYNNPTQTNLIGVPITFSAQSSTQIFPIGTYQTNNSGSVSVSFMPPAFSGTQTLTVIAKTGNLTSSDTVTLVGL
jgi:hypothetical protein